MPFKSWGLLNLVLLSSIVGFVSVHGLTGFEKLTDLDYRGNTYYSIRNLSLHECQGWCRQEPECAAAAFSFVVNPLAPMQETLCLLQNDTSAHNPSAVPQKAASMYYMVKLHIRSEKVCSRPWTFERVPNKMLRNLDNSLIFTSTKEACLAACLNERRFTCRSAEYNYVTLQCHLSEEDRRTAPDSAFIDATGVDYFENLCLSSNSTCKSKKSFTDVKVGVPPDRVAHYVGLHYYVDKELQAPNLGACKRACEVEDEFLCRSLLYKANVGSSTNGASIGYNCQLYHMDHKTLPDGPATYLNTERPLLDNGNPLGQYLENHCEDKDGLDVAATPVPVKSPAINGGSGGIGVGNGGSSGGIGTNGGGIGSGPVAGGGPPLSLTDDILNGNNGQFNLDAEGQDCDHTGTCYDVQVQCKDTRIAVQVRTNKPFNGRIYAMGRSETCNVDVIDSDVFRLDLSLSGQDCNTQSVGGVYTNTVVLQHHSVVMTKADKIYKVKCTYDISSRNITFGMMPIRDLDTISITSAPEAPPPKIKILDAFGKEVETVRIGDRLTFRIEIPNNTPYGIFARSCIAMAKDSRSTFSIIDDEGCPVEPTIFPKFSQSSQSALISEYEAFRFTESYGVIFQCNVKYCLGPCPPAECVYGREKFDSYGRRKRRTIDDSNHNASNSANSPDLTLSQEILVLDFNEELPRDLPPKYTIQDDTDQSKNNNNRRRGSSAPSSYSHHQKHRDNSYSYETIDDEAGGFNCPTRSSVLVLSVVCGLLLLMYVASVVCFMAKSRPWRNNHHRSSASSFIGSTSSSSHKHIMQ